MGLSGIEAVIVAGGRGLRLRPATDALPKPMLPVEGRPLLEHQLEWLKASGFSEVRLCLGYKAEAVSSYFGDGSRLGLRLRYHVESRPRGTAGCVKDIAADLSGDALIVYGDLFVSMDLKRLLDFHRSHPGLATLVACQTDHPRDSDLMDVEGDRVRRFYRAEPGKPCGTLACAAVWVVRPPLLDLAPADKPSDFGRDVFPLALGRGLDLRAYVTDELLADLGTAERIEAFRERRAA